MEPYPTPNLIKQDLNAILNAVSFTDRIVFGRMNYNKDVSSYPKHKDFYTQCVKRVVKFCHAHAIACHIKSGTLTQTAVKADTNANAPSDD